MRPGVYVIADPPPPPQVKPAAPTANVTAGRTVAAGPPMPAPGKNLMVGAAVAVGSAEHPFCLGR